MGNGTIDWGIIGTGDVAEHKCGPALYKASHSRLVAVTNRNVDKAASFARRHGVERVHETAEELLADPDLDAVYVATPPVSHPRLVEQAAAAGKHILCEKPMANSVAECDNMIRVCRDHGVQLMIAYYRRFFPAVVTMRRLMDEGAIGRPLRARAAVAEMYRPGPDGERGWLVDPLVSGGGFLTDVATHRLDLFAYFFGRPTEVMAMVETQSLDLDVDDATSLLVRFENGVHAAGSFSWNVDASIDELEIWGSTGRMRAVNLGDGLVEIWSGERHDSFRLPARQPTHLGLVEHYVGALLNSEPNSLPGEEGRWATAISEAAYEASRNRVAVRIQATGAETDLP